MKPAMPAKVAATLALAGMVAGCVTPNPETATVVAMPKTGAQKAFTSFTPALRCMDDMFLAYGKKDIVMTSAGIPDSTGKVTTGTKEMLYSAVSKMSTKSKAITFIDYDTEKSDLLMLFQDVQAAGGGADRKLPSYYIRGAITQLDDNALDSQAGASIALPFADFGISKDQVVSLITVDMNIGETASRMILPGVNASNTMAIVRSGKAGEAGGKIGKAGININMSLNKSEGTGAGVRALIELGLIEVMGKLTNTPYWKCLEIDKANPSMIEQARDWYDSMPQGDRVVFVQRKLTGLGAYSGPADGQANATLSEAIGKFQAQNNLIADGRVNFDLYYALLDDNPMSEGPATGPKLATAAAAPARAPSSAGPLDVTVTSDRGQKAVYKVKEALKAQVSMNRDGFLYCYYKDGAGTISRVYPNRFQHDPYVKGNTTITIPGEGTPFKIRFDQAGAKEQVLCLGSDRDVALPASLKGNDLSPLQIGSVNEVIAAFKKSNPQIGEGKLDISVQ